MLRRESSGLGGLQRPLCALRRTQFSFGGLSSLLVSGRASMTICRRAKPASVCARRSANILRLAPSTSARTAVMMSSRCRCIKLGKTLSSPPQLLYGSLAFFKTTGEIAHTSPICFMHELLKQTA